MKNTDNKKSEIINEEIKKEEKDNNEDNKKEKVNYDFLRQLTYIHRSLSKDI